MPRIGVGLGLGLFQAGGFDASAQAFFAATGITDLTQQQAINNLVVGLKSDGLWSKMKALYPFVTDQRNLASYSEDITSAIGWNSASITRSANTTTAPNGTITADTFTTTANANNVFWNLGFIAGNSQTFTNSIYLKYNNAQWVTLEIWNGGGQDGIRLWVDVQNGVLGSANATVGTYITSTITSVGNGWYRVSLTGIVPLQNALLALRHVDGNGAYNFTSVSGKSTYCWGAQNEIGVLTDYQPQLTSAQSAISNQFKYNLVNPVDSDAAFRLVFNGGWTFASTGATPNGTNGYADTKLVPSSNGLSYDNNHISFYSRTSAQSGAIQFYEMGSGNATGTDNLSLFVRRSADLAGYDSGDFTTNRASFTNTNGQGFYCGTAPTTTSKYFKNGVSQVSKSLSVKSISGINVYIGAFNENNVTTYYSQKQCALASIGDGLTDTEASNLYSRVQSYQTALSRQV